METQRGAFFTKQGKPYFLISGEIHYFRLAAEHWRTHLTRLKASGANTVSTYIPWDWHETEQGKFDFDGSTHPSRNLLGFIALCKEVGLDMIVKPGPYILAEYQVQGLPGWLCSAIDPSAFARDESGEIIRPDVFTYLSDAFLHFVFRWYAAVMPIIGANQRSQGGPIVIMQVCNEVGIFQWLYGKVDYNQTVVELYRVFIEKKYETVDALNGMYGTRYRTFAEASPPSGKIRNRREFAAYYDFHLFYRWYFARYFDMLIATIRGYGIDVQLTHNIPGWIYGNASELPMLMSTYADAMKRGDVWFGLDHIPEFFSFRNIHSAAACNKILRAMQKGPVWAAEFQAGTREHHVKCDANDMRAFYYASLAHGLKGFNYYMFSQGINPPGKGYFGRTFYFQTALNSEGVPLPLYGVISKVNRFIRRGAARLVFSETVASVCVGLYKPYFCTELTSSQMLKEPKLDIRALGLAVDPREMRETLWFNGFLRALQTLNFAYDVHDLEDGDLALLLGYKQLWVISAEYMDRRTQEKLVDYVSQGGHLILSPAVPALDEYLRPCTALADAIGVTIETAECGLIVEALGITDLYTHTSVKQLYRAEEARSIARSSDGQTCGIELRHGKGTFTALGFSVGYSSDEHLKLYEMIIRADSIVRDAEVSDPEIQFTVRQYEGGSDLFLLNPHNEAKRFMADGRSYVMKPFSCRIVRRRSAP